MIACATAANRRWRRRGSPPPSGLPGTSGEERLSHLMNAYEAKIIQDALENNGHNISRTAKQLQISRTNLHNKIKKYNLEKAEG